MDLSFEEDDWYCECQTLYQIRLIGFLVDGRSGKLQVASINDDVGEFHVPVVTTVSVSGSFIADNYILVGCSELSELTWNFH